MEIVNNQSGPVISTPNEFVDLKRYPITDLGSETGRKLLKTIHTGLSKVGASCLPNFLRAEAPRCLAREANAITHLAYRGPAEASPYFFNYQDEELAKLPRTHPLRRKTPRRLSQVACDLIPEDSGLKKFYYWQGLADFLAAATGHERLYPSEDKYQALNISVMPEHGCQQWHFDNSECVITLLLQEPESGGDFEYVPNIRSDENENYAEVEKVLNGEHEHIKRINLKAGALMLFRGRYSLHRVTPVIGKRPRLQSIYGFNPMPGVKGRYLTNVLHYGKRVIDQSHSKNLRETITH